jgi:quercetin dioxygenase-like cupin family protein
VVLFSIIVLGAPAGRVTNGGAFMPDATHYRWRDLPAEAVNPSALRQYVTGEALTVARFELARGGLVPRHAHMNEQVSCVLSGALKFRFDGQEIVARAGEVVQIPGMVHHEVEVLEDSIVMDVFSPVRRDWIEKTDDYFRAR